jgi:hypothetical protein
MDRTDLFNAIDELFAEATGSIPASSIGDSVLAEKVRQELESQRGPGEIYPEILMVFLKEQYLADLKFGIEDLKEFVRWVDKFLEID